MDDAKQVSTEFKVRAKTFGGHTHCSLFSRPKGQSTWQKCGDFVIGNESQLSFYLAARGFEYEDEAKGVEHYDYRLSSGLGQHSIAGKVTHHEVLSSDEDLVALTKLDGRDK